MNENINLTYDDFSAGQVAGAASRAAVSVKKATFISIQGDSL